MAMTANQMVDLFDAQADMHWSAAESAVANGDYDLLAFNLSSALDSHLMVGLLKWRQGKDNPSASLAHACEVAVYGLKLLKQVAPGAPHWQNFDVLPAAYCAILLEEPIEIPVDDVLIGCQREPREYLPQCLDACILTALRKRQRPFAWDGLTAELCGERRLDLLCRTYHVYLSIALHEPGNEDAAFEDVKAAAGLFRARQNDPFFAGGRGTDGGGPDNQYVVDYRCAALTKYSLAPSVGDMNKKVSIHQWSW